MAKTVAIGIQDFEKIRQRNVLYIDKTLLIKEWWEREDDVTLITRPRRFGKTLNLSMLECFFSNKYEGRSDLFEGLDIWKEEKFRNLQGQFPVIFLSFAGIKQDTYEKTRLSINLLIKKIYDSYSWLKEEPWFLEAEEDYFSMVGMNMEDPIAADSLNTLCGLLSRKYGKKCIILLDEYDTPLQEAYINGYWDKLTGYIRALFNNTFKTNQYLERALMTGITRVSKESIFSDFNNPNVVTTTTNMYQTAFGFTEQEVFEVMDSQGISEEEKSKIKFWYDGFTFGGMKDIYNPWSVIMYLNRRELDAYWANTSSNGIISKLLMQGDAELKSKLETLLCDGNIETIIDEQIVFTSLDSNVDALWSLLLACGYLKADKVKWDDILGKNIYSLSLTNFEVKTMFMSMINGWFSQDESFNKFIMAMLLGNTKEMNQYMNKVALNTFSYFDTGNKPSAESGPERFYHGFVLGLMVDKAKDYLLYSNRESGFGRYDVVMEPKDKNKAAIIIEFKVLDKEYDDENGLEDTAKNALLQIEEKKYEEGLVAKGIKKENILKYGFAFRGKKCLIMKGR